LCTVRENSSRTTRRSSLRFHKCSIEHIHSLCQSPLVGVSNKLIDLRKLLAERFPQPASRAPSVLTTALPFFDQTIGGGLPKSAITELIIPQPSAGSASLIHALLRSAQRERHFVALIDGSDSFDPGSSDNSVLRHLLWVRCRKTFDAIKAADFLLR